MKEIVQRVWAVRRGLGKTLGEFALPEARFPAIFSDAPTPGRSLWFPARWQAFYCKKGA